MTAHSDDGSLDSDDVAALTLIAGKLSLARMGGRYYLFARANLLASGGRHIQVALRSLGSRQSSSPNNGLRPTAAWFY